MIPMSLNFREQMLYDYLLARPEERQYWQEKVHKASRAGDESAAAHRLEIELWRYFEERSAVAEPFRSLARRDPPRRSLMRNLAELLLRLWGEQRPRRERGGVDGRAEAPP